MRHILVASLLALGACSMAQEQQTAADFNNAKAAISNLCTIAMPIALATAAVPVYGPFISAGVQVACGSAQGIATLAQDPSSVAWLQQQIDLLNAGAKAAGIRVGG